MDVGHLHLPMDAVGAAVDAAASLEVSFSLRNIVNAKCMGPLNSLKLRKHRTMLISQWKLPESCLEAFKAFGSFLKASASVTITN